jgi:energy-coupling factor transporter ATP-binding protein EcfA2
MTVESSGAFQAAEDVALRTIRFRRFKALEDFSLTLGEASVLVGPNNAGKSTAISSLRILGAALLTARAKRPIPLPLPTSPYGYLIPADSIPVTLLNVHTNYADTDAEVGFVFSNGNYLRLIFPADGGCFLVPEVAGRPVRSTGDFRTSFPFRMTVVPILGPVEDDEVLVESKTVRRNLASHRASRNFRNYWYHFPDGFEQFVSSLAGTWPGVTISRPAISYGASGTILHMFCSESRISRELFWMGIGFQIWCQILTYIVLSHNDQLFVVDEPEIYLHPDLQRQLLNLLRDAGPDILLATHSSDLVAEADPRELVVVDKRMKSGQRLKSPADVAGALRLIGSAQSLVLTQLARTRRMLILEGEEFAILRGFARVLGYSDLAMGANLSSFPYGGFPVPEAVQAIARGVEEALGSAVVFAGVFDRDYRSDREIADVLKAMKPPLSVLHIFGRKEIENYLLVPSVLQRAASAAVRDRARRGGREVSMPIVPMEALLEEVTEPLRRDVHGQYVAKEITYKPGAGGRDAATITASVSKWFDPAWADLERRMGLVPGKRALADLNTALQGGYGVSLTWRMIIAAFRRDDVPIEMQRLLADLDRFTRMEPPPT